MKHKTRTGFLARLSLTGAAGVDSPAHGHPGWVVMKGADDDVAAAVNEALAPAVEALREDRDNLRELAVLIDEHANAIDELTEAIHGRIEKAEDDLRTQAARLADQVRELHLWSGANVRPSQVTNLDNAGRMVWGLS